jgi:hypothetical protein
VNPGQVVSTLGRTLLLVSDHLKKCPFDSPENLNVFMIVFENPLLLQPNKLHVVLQRVSPFHLLFPMSHTSTLQLVTGILAIPKSYRVMFFGWLKHFSSEYFSRILLVMQSFLSFILTNKASNLDSTPVVLVIDRSLRTSTFSLLSLISTVHSLFSCNNEANIVPISLFCNQSVPQAIPIVEEWNKFKTSDVSRVFNFFSYPFLFPLEAKNQIIRSEFKEQMQMRANRHFNKYFMRPSGVSDRPLPRGVVVRSDAVDPLRITLVMELKVRRDDLLHSLEETLRGIIEDDISTLLLPLK